MRATNPEVAINHSLCRTPRLLQSSVKQAVAVKLVPQDPADELASTLLKQTNAARTSSENQNAVEGKISFVAQRPTD